MDESKIKPDDESNNKSFQKTHNGMPTQANGNAKKKKSHTPGAISDSFFFNQNREEVEKIAQPVENKEIIQKTEHPKNSVFAFGNNNIIRNDEMIHKIKKTKTFGRYTIIKELGIGGMGMVYQAYDPKVDRKVALKLILTEQNANKIELSRFRQEAKAMARLNHPNIVTLYDIGDENGQPFFTMELIEGISLKWLIKKRNLSIIQAIEIMCKIGLAIEYAHSKGIIHRDLKPANIIINRYNEPKVMDFGLAKLIYDDIQISHPGMIIGTPQYMSPEQAEGKEIDFRTDIYSLGTIMYEMLTMEPTFSGESTLNVMYKIVNDKPVPLHKKKPSIPKELETICFKALAKRKEDRYPSAKDFVNDLLPFKEKKDSKIISIGNVHNKKKNRMIGTIVGVLAIIGILFFFLKRESQYLQNQNMGEKINQAAILSMPMDKKAGATPGKNGKADTIQIETPKNIPATASKKNPIESPKNPMESPKKTMEPTKKTMEIPENIPATASKKNPIETPENIPATTSKKNPIETPENIPASVQKNKIVRENKTIADYPEQKILLPPLEFKIRHKNLPKKGWEEAKDTLFTDWYYQINIKITRKIYLYGFQLDSTGNLQAIFPKYDDKAIPFTNPIEAGTYQIPPTNSGFTLDEKIGTEKFYFLYNESYLENPSEILNSHINYLQGKEGKRYDKIIERIYQHN